MKFVVLLTILMTALLMHAKEKDSSIKKEDSQQVAEYTVVHNFKENDASSKWVTVNDNVMGGRSKGGFVIKKDRLIFSGATNTNGGGFSSIRTKPQNLDFQNKQGVIIKFKGDGRTYKFDARMGNSSVAHRVDFKTKANPKDWQTVKIDFASLSPTWRGMALYGRRFELDAANIRSIGFMIYDKKDGPFELKVDWIKAY